MKGCDIGNTGSPLDSPQCFGPGALRLSAEADGCRAKDIFHEDVGLLDPIGADRSGTIGGALKALPGCNPIQPGPQRAIKAVCPIDSVLKSISLPAQTQILPAKSSTTRAAAIKTTTSSSPPPSKTPSASSLTAPGVKLPSGWTYSGCFSDNIDPRSLGTQGEWWGEPITSTNCVEHCKSIGKSIAGTENGGQCFCGNELKQSQAVSSGECDQRCLGDNRQICGGSGTLSIFRKTIAVKKPRRHRQRHV